RMDRNKSRGGSNRRRREVERKFSIPQAQVTATKIDRTGVMYLGKLILPRPGGLQIDQPAVPQIKIANNNRPTTVIIHKSTGRRPVWPGEINKTSPSIEARKPLEPARRGSPSQFKWDTNNCGSQGCMSCPNR